jgi:hypothetical protein
MNSRESLLPLAAVMNTVDGKSARTNNRLRILVVDDDQVVQVLTRILEDGVRSPLDQPSA